VWQPWLVEAKGCAKWTTELILNEDYMLFFFVVVVLTVFKLLSQINGNPVNVGDLFKFIISVRWRPL